MYLLLETIGLFGYDIKFLIDILYPNNNFTDILYPIDNSNDDKI